MKLMPSKVGAEPKKVAILGGLLLVLLAVFLMNRSPDAPQAAAIAPGAQPAPAPVRSLPARASTPAASNNVPASLTPMPPTRTAARRGDASIQDFKPTLKLPEGMDVSHIDPALKLDLLAKLEKTDVEAAGRNIFEFGAAPKPGTPPPAVKPIKPGDPVAGAAPGALAGATPGAAPAKPAPPPIPLKFYGYVNEPGSPSKRAFFLDGDDIIVAGENDVIHSRYKIVRIGVNSAVIEDETTKNQQTVPLVEELPG
jgi:hypothetical protein